MLIFDRRELVSDKRCLETHEEIRARIAKEIEAFRASGKEIEQVPAGAKRELDCDSYATKAAKVGNKRGAKTKRTSKQVNEELAKLLGNYVST